MTTLPATLTNDNTVIPLSRIAVIDLEASSLGSASYPTEIGWALLNDDGTISTSGACLIRPAAKWTTFTNAWSAASERLTGITRDMCQRRWKTRPHASVRTGQFRAVFSDGRDWVSALARALPI